MKLVTLGSSSAGNCYLLQGERETLVLECGVRPALVKKALNFDFSKVVGAVVTHSHNDHAGYVREFVKLGVPVLGLDHTLTAKNVVYNHFARVIVPGRGYKLGGFKIIPFELEHDVPCVGYHISHPELGNLLFVTDTCVMRYRFNGLNHVLIEANYDDEILDENIRRGSMPGAMRPRLLKSHLELDSVKAILLAQDRSELHNVVLLHLSGNNANAGQFTAEVAAAIGLPVHVAAKGTELKLERYGHGDSEAHIC